MKRGDVPQHKKTENVKSNSYLTAAFTLTMVLIGMLAVGASAQPINDNFSNAIPILDIDSTNAIVFAGATKEPGEPNHCGYAGGWSVWYSWTAPQSGLASVDGVYESGGGFVIHTESGDGLIAAYTGESVDRLYEVGNNLALYVFSSSGIAEPYPSSKLSFSARAGQNYKIAFDKRTAPSGNWTNKFKLSLQPAPANDDFANPVILTGSNCIASGTTLAGTEEPGEPPPITLNTTPGSVWYSWTAPSTGYAELKADRNYDLDLYVYTGSTLSSLTLLAESTPRNNNNNNVSFPVQEGATYRIAVRMLRRGNEQSNYGNQSGPFEFSIRQAPVAISEPNLESVYIDPTNVAITAFLDASNTNVRWVSFYDGLTFLNESDNPPYSFLLNNVLPGEHSFRAVSVGDATNVSSPVIIRVYPANDHFTNSTPLTGTNLSFDASIGLATHEEGELGIPGLSAGQTCWRTWTAPRDGRLILSLSGTSFSPAVAVYTGDDLYQLSPVASGFGRVSASVQAGCTYHISADSFHTETYFPIVGFVRGVAPVSPFTFGLQLVTPPPNDNFEKRSPLNGITIKVRGSNLGASVQPNEPAHGGISQGNSIWYSWKAPISGSVTVATNSLVIKTNSNPSPIGFPFPWPPIFIYPNPGPPGQWGGTGSTMPSAYPVFAIYTGSSLATLTNLASGPVVRFDAVAGQTYQIAVDGNQANPTNLQFYLNEVPPAANDDFNRAPSIYGDTQVTGSNLGATVQPGEPKSNAGDTSGHSVWWIWHASKPTICSISLSQSDNWFSPVTIYVGNSVATLKSVGAGHGNVSFIAIPGIPYHICVGSDHGYTGNIRMNIHQYPLIISRTPVVIGISGPHPTR